MFLQASSVEKLSKLIYKIWHVQIELMRIFVKKEVYEFRNYFNPIVFLYSRICHDFMHTYKKKYANSIFRISFLHSY